MHVINLYVYVRRVSHISHQWNTRFDILFQCKNGNAKTHFPNTSFIISTHHKYIKISDPLCNLYNPNMHLFTTTVNTAIISTLASQKLSKNVPCAKVTCSAASCFRGKIKKKQCESTTIDWLLIRYIIELETFLMMVEALKSSHLHKCPSYTKTKWVP